MILDLGCGAGAGLFRLLARLPDAEAVGVDASGAGAPSSEQLEALSGGWQ